ncbi:MAG: DUF501 domain-containing protein, partial [Thermoleophilia bacterium]|nr:DUF501 domain-containing protein [Thermoleophilia bacterium]
MNRRDEQVVGGQLGRPPRGVSSVPVRCPFGYPAVIESLPLFPDGTPNPNLYYVTCPALVRAVSRVEGRGGVGKLRALAEEPGPVQETLRLLQDWYRVQRRHQLQAGGFGEGAGPAAKTESETGAQPTDSAELEKRAVLAEKVVRAGIGGPESPEKASCLHAYAAAFLAASAGRLDEEAGLAARAAQAWESLLPPLETLWCREQLCLRWEQDRSFEQDRGSERRAVIDVGTVSVRLLVADVPAADGQTGAEV